MDFQTRKNVELSRYEIYVAGVLAGFADFKIDGLVMALPHTVVEPEFGGKGIGGALVAFALNDARADGLKVAPYCSFVAKTISKNLAEYGDLVPKEFSHLLPTQ
mgnify:FL=1